MSKQKLYTKKHLARARRRAAEEDAGSGKPRRSRFWWKHDGEMRRALKGVDLDRYEELTRESGRG